MFSFSLLFEHDHQSKIVVSRCYHQILEINFFTLYFRFPYDLLPSDSFLLMNELYYYTDLQVGHVHQQIFFVLLAEKYLNIFSLIVLLNLSITQDFLRFFVE